VVVSFTERDYDAMDHARDQAKDERIQLAIAKSHAAGCTCSACSFKRYLDACPLCRRVEKCGCE
jgi:hypothetical protein